MTFTEFINTNIRKDIDYDKAFGTQCVDVFRQYALDVLKLPVQVEPVEGAKDFWEKYDNMPTAKMCFEKIPEKKDGRWGDVAIWGASRTNKYGHIALVLVVEDTELCVLEQNGLRQGDGCVLKWRSFENFLGYLRVRRINK